MRASLVLSAFALVLATTTRAEYAAWTSRIGSGLQDQAGQVAVGSQNFVFTTSVSDGNLFVSKLEPVNGAVMWTRNMGPAVPVDLESVGDQLVVAANASDAQGKPHALTYALAQSDGATRWNARGIGGPETGTAQTFDIAITGSRVVLSGTQDGRAVIAELQPYLGTWMHQTWLNGSVSRSVKLDGALGWASSEASGKGWVSAFDTSGYVSRSVQLAAPSRANSRFQNVRLFQGSGLWAASEMQYGNTSYLFASPAFSSEAPYAGIIAVSTGTRLLDAIVLDGSAFPGDTGAGAPTRLRVAARSFDANGNPLRREWLFGRSTSAGSTEALISSPMFVSAYGASGKTLGHVNLSSRGWDFAVGRVNSNAIKAFDAGLNSDDEMSDEQSGYALVTSFRNGKSETRLLALRSLTSTSSQLVAGQSVDFPFSLGGPAPAGGLTVTVRTPANSPLRLQSNTVFVPEGSSNAVLRVEALSVADTVNTQVTFTCRRDSAVASVQVLPVKLASLTVTPGTVVGCTNPTGRVILNGPAPAGGYVVQLSESSTILDTEDQVVVPAGQRWVDFVVCTFATRVDASPSLTATDRFGSIQRSITVLRPSLSSLRWDLATVRSNSTVCARVRLNAVAPGGGFVVDNATTGAIRCPGSTPILANQQEAQIVATTLAVTSPTRSTLTVTLNGRTMSASIVVVP